MDFVDELFVCFVW